MKLRNGRLQKKMDEKAAKFTSSLEFDHHIFYADIECNLAHTRMLAQEGIINKETAKKIIQSLKELKKKGMKALNIDPSIEDIHMAIEEYVTEKIGDEAGFMHTGKSRNDQVATDLRLALKEKIQDIQKELLDFIKVLAEMAEDHKDTIIVGYTHLQHAQATTFAHHLLAYAYSLKRDYERLKDAYRRVDVNPLGSAALTTTSFPINRELTTRLLGFKDYMENSMDAVSSRDFIAETIFDLAMIAANLSRICEEIILWSTYEFGLIELADEFSSTSSIMPQKKNPDVAEITRAKTSNIYSNLIAVLGILKGLPYTYNRDLQEITPHLWDAIETCHDMILMVRRMLSTIRVDKDRGFELAVSNFATATDLADTIVKEKNIPFRTAHKIVGRLINHSIKEGINPLDVDSRLLDKISEEVMGKKLGLDDKIIKRALDPRENVKMRNVPGGPSPTMIDMSIKRLRAYVESELGSAEP
ncbi:MAG TPA: argininosuccinate lyase [Methanothermobacter sp.]|nr:argininosuccinate lyase [Methanothermobacter sp. MT-2]HHW05168.1 argininosuccinate lyase [Methanothermobacter sp.]HOK73320.1 argininosuccinate lyase [Methanothermobacter sp.]HOL69735.1 argininosuccinate lyase [Methanothermobacter sp.]HPQ05169.1 argininosuccinate lyase [Methanothermobacter sp.]